MSRNFADTSFNDADESTDIVPVQLTKTEEKNNGEKNFIVDISAVKDVLGNPQYENHYAAIYTIAGPSRTGKSFLLNLLWNFLQKSDQKNDYKQWSKATGQVEKIFEWKRDVKPCTQGIYILKEPIVIPHNEEKIALFLADTQGIFDHNTSQRNQTFLGTFSFLISSFMIFNVQNRIEGTHLDAIYKSATNLRGSDRCYTMQRESLMFVVRDSNDVVDDDDYGMEGGKKYFKAAFQEDDQNKAEEHKMMREFLKFAFGDNIPCCLLPHPGDAVKRETCSVTDLNDDFQKETFKLFQEMESGCKRTIKTIHNKLLKCKKLYENIQGYVSQFGLHLDVSDHESFLMKEFRLKMNFHVISHVEEFLDLSTKQEIWKKTKESLVSELKELKIKQESSFRKKVAEYYSNKLIAEWEEELSRVLTHAVRNLTVCLHVDQAYKKAILDYNKCQKKWAELRLSDNASWATITRAKRKKLLEEMEISIGQQAANKKDSEYIFSQCKVYFEEHSNKLSAAIDEDIDVFLKKMESSQTTIQYAMIGLKLGFSVLAGGYNLFRAIRGCGKVINAVPGVNEVVGQALNVANDVIANACEPVIKIGRKIVASNFVEDIQSKITSAEKNQLLKQYEDGEMAVELSFGILRFKLEVQKRLQDAS